MIKEVAHKKPEVTKGGKGEGKGTEGGSYCPRIRRIPPMEQSFLKVAAQGYSLVADLKAIQLFVIRSSHIQGNKL